MTVEAVLFPLDCLKTRVQSKLSVPRACAIPGIYRGVGTAVLSSAPSSAIFFTVYESSKQVLARGEDPWGSGQSAVLVASTLGELAACTVRVPTDLVKQRLQAGYARSFADAARSVLAVDGSVLAASFRATAARDVLQSGLQFQMYESLKALAARQTGCDSDQLQAQHCAVCGSIAGATSAVLTTPVDLLRTRMNLRDAAAPRPSTACSASAWRSLAAEEALEIYRCKGFGGFFAGTGFRAASMGTGGFIFLGAFEFAKAHFGGREAGG